MVGAMVSVLPLGTPVKLARSTEHCELLSVPVVPGWPVIH